MAYQSEPEKNIVYEKETIIRNNNGGGKDGASHTNGPRATYKEGLSGSFHSNGHSASFSHEPSMSEYLKGFSKVAKKAMKECKEGLFDVCQSLFVLFMQHPAVGILFLVTGLFVTVPVGLFLGFAVFSFISIVVTALFIEGVVLGTGLVVLFFVVPVAFIVGVGAACFASASWIAVTSAYSFFRGRNTFDISTTKTD